MNRRKTVPIILFRVPLWSKATWFKDFISLNSVNNLLSDLMVKKPEKFKSCE